MSVRSARTAGQNASASFARRWTDIPATTEESVIVRRRMFSHRSAADVEEQSATLSWSFCGCRNPTHSWTELRARAPAICCLFGVISATWGATPEILGAQSGFSVKIARVSCTYPIFSGGHAPGFFIFPCLNTAK